MDKDYLVTKSNYFIMNSNYDLSLEEQKIILTLASLVEPNDQEFKSYIFKIKDFMKLLNIEDKSKYTKIPKITKGLMKKVFEIQEGKTLIQTAWLCGAKYEKGTGYVELMFSPLLKPYMLKLNTMFTQYKLGNILNMKSKYSPRIFELLKCNEFKEQGYINIEIKDLRKLLKADSVYPLYNDFKRFVIERTQKELAKLSDISFEFEEIKTGRKVTALKVYIHANKVNKVNKVSNKAIVKIKITDQLASQETCASSDDEPINKIVQLMADKHITPFEARKIYDSSIGKIDVIYKVYNHFKNKKANNFVGLLINQVKPGIFQENKKNYEKGNFSNINVRNYTNEKLDEIERKLLGLDNCTDSSGQKYNQITFPIGTIQSDDIDSDEETTEF